MANDQGTVPTERSHRWYRVSKKDILQSCSSALVPLMIGVMTFVMTIQQHKQGIENRSNDLQIGKYLRDQQLKLTEARRTQDREFENARREQDRMLDNHRRQQDEQLKNRQRQQDFKIAETIRLDFLLSEYLNEMSRLLINYNFTLNEKVRQTVARPKTLTALQQLDSNRKGLLLEFLYQSNLIRGQHQQFEASRINMGDADFKNIDLTNIHVAWRILTYLSLAGSELINASFRNCDITASSFERALMKGTSFRDALVSDTKFFRTSLVETDFTNADIHSSDLTSADLTGSNITDEQLWTSETFNRAILPNGTTAFVNNLIQNGDANDCTLEYWNIQMNDSIHIRYNNKCTFQANVKNGNVTMSQLIDNEKIRMPVWRGAHYIEVRIDIMKILPSYNSTFVKLRQLFYNKNQSIVGEEETIVDTTKLTTEEVHTISWITNGSIILQKTYSLELFVTFHYSLTCDNIGLYLEKKRIFFEDE